MEIFYMNERLAALPAAVTPLSAVQVSVAGARPWAPQVHWVETQSELILAPAPNEVQGTSGFPVKGADVAKRYLDVRGVPPRGRPV